MNDMITSNWHEAADSITFRTGAFINGAFRTAKSGNTFATTSPIDGRHLVDIADCGAADIDEAVSISREAFDSGIWSKKSPRQRKDILLRFADMIRENRDELALLITLDVGKAISDSRNIELRSTADCFSWYAETIDKIYDEIAPTAPGTHATITREPLGVVAAVVPWNFPLIMAAWKVAPALAMGNSVILKPSEYSSLSALRLAEIGHAAGIPAGVFNVVPGFGTETGRALGEHMDVDGLFFTGSTQVGKIFMEYAAKSNLKRIALELGGKSPNIILESYKNTRHAAETAAGAAFFNQGEMCTCPSRLIVEEGVYDEVVAVLKENAASYMPADPLSEQTNVGALVHSRHADKVMNYIQIAQDGGATLEYGGARAEVVEGGTYVEPTIFTDVTNDMRIAREEVFGPVIVVIKVKDVEEAIEIANDTNYGLASAVWTDDLSTAHHVSKSIRAGLVYVNCYDADDITIPFGGYKQSGMGRDKSMHALDKYAELKTTWMNIDGGSSAK